MAPERILVVDDEPNARQALETLLTEEGFRRSVLTLVTDPVIHAWWAGYFAPLDRRAQLDIVRLQDDYGRG